MESYYENNYNLAVAVIVFCVVLCQTYFCFKNLTAEQGLHMSKRAVEKARRATNRAWVHDADGEISPGSVLKPRLNYIHKRGILDPLEVEPNAVPNPYFEFRLLSSCLRRLIL